MRAVMRAIQTASLPDPLRTVVMADDLGGPPETSPDGFTLREILAWVTDPHHKTLLCWEIDGQVNLWLADVPVDTRLQVFSGYEAVPIGGTPYSLTYVSGRFLEITRAGRSRKTRATWRVCDVSGFWPTTTRMADSLAEWQIEGWRSALPWDASYRGEWRCHRLTQMTEACCTRAAQLGALMGRVLPALARADLSPSLPMGSGLIANRLLAKPAGDHWLAHYRPDRQPIIAGQELLPLFAQAYYGGRIEATTVGSWAIPTYDYDLSSAYPWALSWLGPVGFCWEAVSRFRPSLEDRMSLWLVRWDLGTGWLGPFPYRERPTGPITYPLSGSGWYWWPEVAAALRAYGESAIRVIRGYVSPASADRPLEAVVRARFAQRRALEAEGSPVAGILKRSLAAMYGKLCQGEGRHGAPGRWYNPALAGWVTSAVRGKLIDAYAGSEGLVIASATDGLLTSLPLPNVTPSRRLGGWKRAVWDRGSLILPGLYRLERDSPPERATAMTGLPGSTDYDWLLGEVSGAKHATVRLPVFLGHLWHDTGADLPSWQRCRWVTRHTTVRAFSVQHKRASTENLLSLDYRTDSMGFRPHQTRGEGESAGHPLPNAWLDQPESLTKRALDRLRMR